jgi:hypothetical protein
VIYEHHQLVFELDSAITRHSQMLENIKMHRIGMYFDEVIVLVVLGHCSRCCLCLGSRPKSLCEVKVTRIVRNLSGILTLAALGHSVRRKQWRNTGGLAISDMVREE